jgi:hypothetical protein
MPKRLSVSDYHKKMIFYIVSKNNRCKGSSYKNERVFCNRSIYLLIDHMHRLLHRRNLNQFIIFLFFCKINEKW